MAVAAAQRGEKQRVAAIIGDGALSGGMAFEALNNAGDLKDIDILVILNDNEMSISPAVGAINNYLGRILASRFYGKMQQGGRRILSGMPIMQRFAHRTHEHIKGMVLPGTLFEEFGFNYVGPIDGHNLPLLISTLSGLRDLPGPQFLHLVTVKGRGFEKAEADPVLYHGVGKFEPAHGIAPMKVEKNCSRRHTLRFLATGYVPLPPAYQIWSPLLRPCARAPVWLSLRRSFRPVILMWALPSSTP